MIRYPPPFPELTRVSANLEYSTVQYSSYAFPTLSYPILSNVCRKHRRCIHKRCKQAGESTLLLLSASAPPPPPTKSATGIVAAGGLGLELHLRVADSNGGGVAAGERKDFLLLVRGRRRLMDFHSVWPPAGHVGRVHHQGPGDSGLSRPHDLYR